MKEKSGQWGRGRLGKTKQQTGEGGGSNIFFFLRTFQPDFEKTVSLYETHPWH